MKLEADTLTPEQIAWMQQLNREAVNLGLPGWPCEHIERLPSCWLADYDAGFTPAEALLVNYPDENPYHKKKA